MSHPDSPVAEGSVRPLKVAWFSFFPVEWLTEVPEEVQRLGRGHPATWQQVLLSELEVNPALQLHVLVVRSQFERSLTFERRGVVFHLLKTPPGLRWLSLFWADTWMMRRVLRQVQPDVVHAWGFEYGAITIAVRRLKYPYVATMQGLMNWIVTLTPPNGYQRIAAHLERRTLPGARTVTAESRFAVAYLRERYPHLDLHQVEHAPSRLFHDVQRRPQLAPVRFLYVGAFSAPKGADLLCRALAGLPTREYELVIAGGVDPSLRQELEGALPADFWTRVQFRQFLSSAAVAEEMARATLLIYPSRADNSPNVVKEAVVAGLPVVASEVGGIPDYVISGKNGLLFASGDRGACAAAVQTALSHPLFRQGRVEPATLEQVREYLSPRRMAQRFVELYQKVAATAAGSEKEHS